MIQLLFIWLALSAPDVDDDGVHDWVVNCPHVENPAQRDHDGDGQGDGCDDAFAPDEPGPVAATSQLGTEGGGPAWRASVPKRG